MGNSRITSHNAVRKSGNIEYQGTSLYAIYSYPQRNHGFQIHGKLGFFSLATNTNLDYVSQNNDTGLSAGGAVSYYNREGWGGQASASIHSAKAQVFSFVFSRRFSLVTVETKLAGNQQDGANNSNLRGVSFSQSGGANNLVTEGGGGGSLFFCY